MGLKLQFSDLPTLNLLNDDGGESIVYRLPSTYSIPGKTGPFLFKRYRDGKVLAGHEVAIEFGLDRIISAYEATDPRYRKIIDEVAAWPIATVVGDSGALGLIMREIGPAFMGEASSENPTRIDKLEMWIQKPSKTKSYGLHPFTDEGRRRFTRRTLYFFQMVHAMKWVIGDISFGNILAHVPESGLQATKCMPGFIEIDTYRPERGGSAMPQRQTLEFRPPEVGRLMEQARALEARGASSHDVARLKSRANIQTVYTDVYKAALLVLRLYNEGPYPTQARYEPESTKHLTRIFGSAVLAPLKAALDPTPENRPKMSDLAAPFIKG